MSRVKSIVAGGVFETQRKRQVIFWRKMKVKSWGEKEKNKSYGEQFFVTLSDLPERVFASGSQHEEYSVIQ